MQLPQPTHAKYNGLITDIRRGNIKIPQFQRDFVWNVQKSAALLDSVIKGYPVGTFIFWSTKDRLRSVRDLGNEKFPPPKDGEKVLFVLDGQQRLTSLYAALNGLTIERSDGQSDDFSQIYIDLKANDDEKIVIMDVENREEHSFIRLRDLLHGGLAMLAKFPEHLHKKLEEYKLRIENYDFSIIEVRDVPIDVATEIFTRINVSGKQLTLFEIMVAKTYDETQNFDLAQKFEDLVSDLALLDYETLSDATVLQLVSLLLKKECKRQTILELEKDKFIKTWPKAVDAIERAVEYFRNTYRIPVSHLLPYNTLLAPFGYFFARHPDKPDIKQNKLLRDFFWRVSLAGRYSSAVESKLAQDVRRMDKILRGKSPDYDWGVDPSPKFILENGWFNAGRSFTKALLCLFAYHKPESFSDASIVNISNHWLKQANSKNYHHFFPRAYLKKRGVDDLKVNNIVNITIVDDYLNKREIKAKAPSIYMKKFERENLDLSETMQTHLIIDLDKFGVWDDDYDRFLEKRSSEISKKLQKWIVKRDIDEHGQVSRVDDFEEEMTSFE